MNASLVHYELPLKGRLPFGERLPKSRRSEIASGKKLASDPALSSAPSIFFDAVALLPSEEGAVRLRKEAAAIDWLGDAFGHLKVIGYVTPAAPIFEKAAIAADADEGVVDLTGSAGIGDFTAAAKQHRIWEGELSLRSPG
jgi:catalase